MLAKRPLPKLRIDVQRAPFTPSRPRVEQEYDLHEPLGQGSHAVVRRATKRGSQRELAVKTIRSHDEEGQLLAQREYELLAELHHPNIIAIVDLIVDSAASRVDIVMPLISGLSLDALVKRDGPTSEDAARPLFTQLLHAVHYCHAHRVCHRDIKPENLMVSQEGGGIAKLTLMDFNAASKAGGLTPTGTLMFMSPEAWHAKSAHNEMGDMWSVGVCLYFMLAGYLPWVGQRVHVVALEVARFPMRFPADLGVDALSLLTGLLCRDVGQRLMVAGALMHPWCKLSDNEKRCLFGLQTVGEQPPQPSYRDWEIRARKTLKDSSVQIFGPAFESPPLARMPKANTIENMECFALPPESPKICTARSWQGFALQPSSPKHKSDDHYYSTLPCSRTYAPSKAPGFQDWEVLLRREKLQTLYGPPILEPHYRNWEAKERRKHISQLLM